MLAVKNLPANAGDAAEVGSVLGWGRFRGGGNGKPLQCSCLENPMDRGAWQASANGVTELDTAEYTAHSRRCYPFHILGD